ncbi:MAG: hypothetical protein GX556_13795 [Fibrobacter sp.]|nr:hypothetical protein [Fibrobacter sp.]
MDENYNVYIARTTMLQEEFTFTILQEISSAISSCVRTTTPDQMPAIAYSATLITRPSYITGDSGAYKVQLKVAERVRGGSTSLLNGNTGKHSASAAVKKDPEVIFTRTGNRLLISFPGVKKAAGAIFMASGKKLHSFCLSDSKPLQWRPSSKGIYILHVSIRGKVISGKIGFE